jgi:hypothetical protein
MKKYIAIGVTLVVALAIAGAALAQGGDINGSGWWASANVQRIGDAPGSAQVTMMSYAMQGATGEYDCGSKELASFGSGATFFPHVSECVPDGFEGSAVLSSEDEIAAIVQVLNIGYGGWAPGDTPYGRALAAYAGVSSPDTTVRFPLYKNDHNNEMTTFYIQNAGSSETDITAVFKPCSDQGDGTACLGYADGPYTYTVSDVDANRMVVIDATLAQNATGDSIPAGTGSYGGVVITSDSENIAGAVMEHSQDASPATYLKSVAGFAPTQYDDKYWIPQIKAEYPKAAAEEACNSKWSSLMVQNADVTDVDVVVTYTVNEPEARAGTTFTDSATIPPGETAFFMTFQQTDFQAGDLASAEVNATGNIVAMVNEEMRWECTNADLKDLASWPGVPDNAARTRLSVPFYKQEYNGKFQGMVVQNVGSSNAVFTVTMTVIDPQVSGVSVGDEYQFTHTDAKGTGAAKTFVMPCNDITSDLTQIGANDYHDLCDVTNLDGSNVSVVVESSQPIVSVVTEEKGWWIAASQVGDGHSEDAGMYVGIPLD